MCASPSSDAAVSGPISSGEQQANLRRDSIAERRGGRRRAAVIDDNDGRTEKLPNCNRFTHVLGDDARKRVARWQGVGEREGETAGFASELLEIAAQCEADGACGR